MHVSYFKYSKKILIVNIIRNHEILNVTIDKDTPDVCDIPVLNHVDHHVINLTKKYLLDVQIHLKIHKIISSKVNNLMQIIQ